MAVLDLALTRKHCRIDGDYQDDLVQAYIDAAINWLEDYADISLTEGPIVETVPRFKAEIEVCRGPLKSVESITYLDLDGVEQTLTGFRVYDENKIVPLVGFSWPQALPQSDIKINATVGYTEGKVPHKIKQALRLMVSHMVENKEAIIVGTIASEMPMGVTSLIHSVRGERV